MTSTPLQISDISIIIPTLNEEAQISKWGELLLPSGVLSASNTEASMPCGHSSSIPGASDTEASMLCEVIIVDGGSSDQTVSLARSQGFRVESCAPGRGAQLNHGAELASGRILLFVHADTRLPSGFAKALLDCLDETTTFAGAFRLKIKDAGLLLRFIGFCANLRSRFLQLPYGDQAIFIRRDDFLRLGGFPETPIMEDFIFIKRAGKEGRITTLPQSVTTSARRWQRKGIFHTTLINQLVILGFYARIPLLKLALLYRR
ncbi:MAG: TIGR04283 family arsenosugar biosynthesis glycosyltransferase [Desulfoarculaceae bacterium]|nr:TIGR04283 family arsenosugar biosynthesis glycosyltransferase [Desulfoarculaceae bacterium]